MALRRLGIANPDPNTPVLIFTSDGEYLASVLVTNGNENIGSTTVYIDPEGAGVDANFVYITKNLLIEIELIKEKPIHQLKTAKVESLIF